MSEAGSKQRCAASKPLGCASPRETPTSEIHIRITITITIMNSFKVPGNSEIVRVA